MKKLTIFFTGILTLALMSACGDSKKNSWDEDGLRGKVKFVEEKLYLAEKAAGELHKREFRPNGGSSSSNIWATRMNTWLDRPRFNKTLTKYNEDGMRVFIEYFCPSYGSNETYELKKEFTYDGDVCQNEKIYGSDGELLQELSNNYDNTTHQILEQKIRTGSHTSRYVYSYAHDGIIDIELNNVVHNESMSSNEEVDFTTPILSALNSKYQGFSQQKSVYQETSSWGKKQTTKEWAENDTLSFCTREYDRKGKLVSETDERRRITKSYEYNDNGDVISVTVTESNYDRNREDYRSISKKTHYEYEYDEHNNWIKKTTYVDDEPQYIAEREIEYY